jgi:hypothetical protein
MSRRYPFWIGLLLYAVYLLTFSGKFHVMDELAVFAAGHNLAGHGRADINQLIWTNHWTPDPPGVWGQDGHLYTKKAPGISFITAPLIRLGQTLPGLNGVHVGLLTNAFVTALTGSLLFSWLSALGHSDLVAGFCAMGYGLCSFAWVYARMFWESSLLALLFLLAVYALWRAGGRRSEGAKKRMSEGESRSRGLWVLLCGIALAIGLTLRFETAPAVILAGLYLLLASPQPRLFAYSPIRLFAPSLVAGAGLLYFNLVRFGSLTETGYTREFVFRAPWEGTYGLLFSPGVGLFIYAPLVWLLLWGVRPAWRRLPRLYVGLVAGVCLFYTLFYGAWHAWGGTWGWGPRFLLVILPLLMLFVAEGLRQQQSVLGWLAVGVLALLGFGINLLGILVDFNEHFLRLPSNDDFVFNWAHFPPVAHWQILQEGAAVDLIWLRRGVIEWTFLLPALLLLGLAMGGLILSASSMWRKPARYAPPAATALAALLTWQSLTGVGQIPPADRPTLARLAEAARPGDALLVPLPPFGDAQEITVLMMAYLEPALPTFAWIESDPRAIAPAERERLWSAIAADAGRVWLFERWLTQDDLPGPTATRLNREAFSAQEAWFPQSGKLTLYALAGEAPAPTPLQMPFEGGLTLADFALVDGAEYRPGDIIKLRLTWQAASSARPPAESVTLSAQLLNPPQVVAQHDRILVDVGHLPFQPGQQGYGLLLPDDLPPGDYPLIVSLYQAANGRRLLRADGSPDDFVYLATVRVR